MGEPHGFASRPHDRFAFSVCWIRIPEGTIEASKCYGFLAYRSELVKPRSEIRKQGEKLMQLRWMTRRSASCFYATSAILHDAERIITQPSAGFAEALVRFQEALAEDGIESQSLLEQLIPLSARVESNLQLAEWSLSKVVGRVRAPLLMHQYAGLFGDLERAFSALPLAEDESLQAPLERLAGDWQLYGEALLNSIVTLTEADLVVERADAVGLVPLCGGGGTA